MIDALNAGMTPSRTVMACCTARYADGRRNRKVYFNKSNDIKERLGKMRKVRGKINNNGVLEIERAGKFKQMECRKSTAWSEGDMDCFLCNDDCSLFREPEQSSGEEKIKLVLCDTLWYFDEFEDER
jgi:hypothetical protein